MDQGERANFGYLAPTCRLPDNLRISASNEDIRKGRRFDLFASLAICCNSSSPRSAQNYFTIFKKWNLPSAAFSSREKDVQQLMGYVSRAYLTVFHLPHILYKTVGVLESLHCGCLTLKQGELIQLPQRHFNITLSQKFLSDFDWVVFLRGSYRSMRSNLLK
jgi:hypothetical protein